MDDLEIQLSNLQVRIEEYHDWPCQYLFKFIAPVDKVEEVKEIFGDVPFRSRSSKNGNYISLSGKIEMETSGHVLSIYRLIAEIDGVVAL